MPGGLWVPGAVWEFRQNLRALPTTGVQVVQSSTEPTDVAVGVHDSARRRAACGHRRARGCAVRYALWVPRQLLVSQQLGRDADVQLPRSRCSRRRWERFSRAWRRGVTCRTTTMSTFSPDSTAWVLVQRCARDSGVRQGTTWQVFG
jgi:hypothetical protein